MTDHAQAGEPVRLGICIGFGLEPTERWGRLVGIVHKEDGIRRYVVREYVIGDGDFPTGGYRTTSHVFLTPHTTPGGECRESPTIVRLQEGTGPF